MWQPPTLEEMQAMLPQYEFVTLLGRGGMGAVYKAVQVTLDRPVAIKVLPGDLVMDEDVQFAERFKNEARTMARMSHPGIVNVFDFGETQNGLLYIVMEFIDGTDISKLILSQGRLTEDYALAITAHVCDALNYAHRNGVVHRDIKPANILINMAGEIKVADFGLAKANDASQSGGLTKTNMAMGTPDFVAPEAFLPGFALDGRADLYAIGVMLYQMLTGDIPRGMWTMPSQRIGSDPRFDAIIGKAMQTDREMRYQSASEIRQELDAILTTPISVLLQQQQAAAEAAAQAAQAQKPAEVAAPPKRGPAPPSAKVPAASPRGHASPSPAKKAAPTAPPHAKSKSSLGPVLGIAATLVAAAGVYWFMGGGAGKSTAPSTAANTTPSTPPPPAAVKPTPPPPPPSTSSKGPSTFSNFAPTAQWRDELAIAAGWGPNWMKVGSERHTSDAGVALRIFAVQRKDSALRVRFRSRSHGASVDLIQRLNPLENGPRYLVTIWTKAKIEGALDIIPLIKDGPRRKLAPLKRQPSFSLSEEHTAELYAIGDRLSFFFDGELLSEVQDSTLTVGVPGLFASKGIEFVRVETAVLNTSASSTPPPSEVLTFGGHRYQFFPQKLKWDEAKARAETLGGHLATITSQEENQWIKDTYVSKLDPSLSLWLGGTKKNPSQQWTWITGEPFVFTTWGMGEPGALRDECALCFSSMSDGWGDIGNNGIGQADRRGGYLIEWDDLTKPIPAMAPLAASTPSAGSVDLLAKADVARDSTPAAPTMPASAPVAASVTASSPSDPVVAKLETGFRSRYETDVQKPYLNALTALNQSYVTSGISRARAAAQAKGSLAEVTALDAEKAALEKGEGVPIEDNESTPAALKTLRGTYRAALAKITSERDAKAAPLYDLYLKALDAYIADLQKSGKLSEGQQVAELREEIASQKPQAATASLATSKPSAPAPPSPTPPAKPAPPSGSTWRNAAEFLVNNGGTFIASKNGSNFPVNAAKDIPAGRFDIIELNLDRLNSVLPPLKDENLLPLVGLRDLRRVWVRPSGSPLNDGAFAFLAGNDELNWLNLEGVNEVTDEVLPHLASAKKLDYLAIQYATKFTGKGLDYLPCRETLTGLELLACGISPDGLKAIATFKQLRVLRITSGTASDKDFTVLGGLKTLTNLTASTTAFGNKAAEAISTLTGLTRLDLAGSKITNSGLEKLQSLKNLTELILTGTEVSAKAAADFQKALPQCRVSR
jgi:serine/threonine protein kinase